MAKENSRRIGGNKGSDERPSYSYEKIMDKTQTALIARDIEYIKESISDIREFIENRAVTKEELAPVKGLVYGFVSLILIAVVGALITLVVMR